MCYMPPWKLLAHSGIDKLLSFFFLPEDLGIKFPSPFCAVIGAYCICIMNKEGCNPTFVLCYSVKFRCGEN